MATEREWIINKKFLVVFVSIQVIITGLILYALLSPKVVTVQVQHVDNSIEITAPLKIDNPFMQ